MPSEGWSGQVHPDKVLALALNPQEARALGDALVGASEVEVFPALIEQPLPDGSAMLIVVHPAAADGIETVGQFLDRIRGLQ